MSKRAAIYARVSTDLQRDNYSIPSQIAGDVKYARQKGYAIIGDRFVDPNTGYDTLSPNGSIPAYVDDYTSRELSRPGLDAAMDYLERFGFDVLIVYSLDRLARDPYIRQTLELEIEARGAKVEFVLGDYDETPQGEVRKDLDATFAKWENAIRTERFNRGKICKAESGLFVTGPTPYGYHRDERALGGLAVDEEGAEVVRQIFEMYVDAGMSVDVIVATLNREGVPAVGEKWAKTTINRLLKNTVYVGRLYYNKTKCKGGKSREVRGRSEWVEIPTTPIVDNEMFDAAQKRFRENLDRKKRWPKRFYLLGGLVLCDNCGRPYMSQTHLARGRRKTELQTYRHRKSAGHCMNHEVRAVDIEGPVWQEIIALLKDPQGLRDGYEQAVELQKSAQVRRMAQLEKLRTRVTKLENSRQNLIAAYIDPDVPLTKAEYISQKTRMDDEVKTLEEEISSAEVEIIHIPSIAELETLEEFAAQIYRRLESFDPQPLVKREIFELLHIRVMIGVDGSIRLDGWINPTDDDGFSSREW